MARAFDGGLLVVGYKDIVFEITGWSEVMAAVSSAGGVSKEGAFVISDGLASLALRVKYEGSNRDKEE